MEKLKEHYKVTMHRGFSAYSGESYIFKRYRLHCYRHPTTTNERRSADILRCDEDAKEYGVHARAKRNARNLPTLWDDIKVAAWDYMKSWKHNSKRRKQWK